MENKIRCLSEILQRIDKLHKNKQKCSIVGTVRQNRRELPQASKRKQQQHKTSLFTCIQTAVVTLTSYQCKKQKLVVIMSTLHPDVEIPSHNNPKKKPETALFYNKAKAGVDVIDQMARKYSVKVASRRWPIHWLKNLPGQLQGKILEKNAVTQRNLIKTYEPFEKNEKHAQQ